MTENLPAPLVPAGVILRDFAYMPLDVVRLRDSDLVAEVSPEAFRCAVLLWCVSWHQVPAGSLPDDDLLLANYAGFGRVVREWKKHRTGALHGWIKCADGRLYHPVVAEKAIEAQQSRDLHAYKTECARIKKHAQRTKIDADYPTFEEWKTHFETTGSTRWARQGREDQSGVCPGDGPGTESARPEMSRSNGREGKGREGKGREGIVGVLNIDSSANRKTTERAEAVADALRVHGYQVNSDHPAVQQLVGIAVTDAEISEAAAKAKSWLGLGGMKPIGWVVARIVNRRGDGTAMGAGSAGHAAADPAIAAKAEADRKLDNDLIDARHMANIGLYDADKLARAEAEARAAHAQAVAALGLAA